LALLSAEAYEKNPSEDPLFQDYRPDGKSRVAVVALNIVNYQTETSGNGTPEEKSSQFVSGQENVPNPEYEKLVKQIKIVSDALAHNKNKQKPTKDGGYTASTLATLQIELGQTPKTIARDKLVDYTYQEYHLSAKAHIAMKLEMRDMLEKQLLGSDAVEATEQDNATEIAGVQIKDNKGLINRQARIKPTEQLERDAQLDALKALDDKIPHLLSNYIHRYYNEGEKALGQGHASEAVENFLCYWFSFRGQMDEKRSQRIREVVKLNTGLDLPFTERLVSSR